MPTSLLERENATRAGPRAVRLARPLSLRANFAWTLGGNAVAALGQWALLATLAKLDGTRQTVGAYAVALAVTAPVVMLANLQLRSVQATDANGRYAFGDYLGLRLLTNVLALLAIAGLALATPEEAPLVLALGVVKTLEAVSDVFHGLFQRHERLDRPAVSAMLRAPLSLLALGGTVALTGSVVAGAIALAVAVGSVLVVYDMPRAAELLPSLRPRFSPRVLASLARLALPLGVVMMLVSLNASVPRLAIRRFLDEASTGEFAALAYLGVIGTTVVNALGQATTPRLALAYAQGKRRRFVGLLLLLGASAALAGAGLVIAALLRGRELLTFFYRAEYAQHPGVFVWIAAAAAVSYLASVLGYGMTAARYFRVQVPLNFAVTGSLVLLSFALTPRSGLVGAAQAALVSSALGLIGALAVNAHALATIEKEVDA